MKVKRILTLRPDILEKLNKVCEEEGFYRSNFITIMCFMDYKEINKMKIEPIKLREKEKKERIQINIDIGAYEQIKKPKLAKIELFIEVICNEYLAGTKRYNKNIIR